MAKNYNYASIKIKDINITVSRHELMVGHAVHQQITVNARQHKEVNNSHCHNNIHYCIGSNHCQCYVWSRIH